MPVDALPENAVLLHVGPFKTGTTAIQDLLADARGDLVEHGVTYPGTRHAHHAEARALLRRPHGWKNDAAPAPSIEQWRGLVRTIRHLPGRVVLSSEYFSSCDVRQCRRIVHSMGSERLQVLIAARNPGSIALSNWQQVLKAARTGRLEDWLEERFRRPVPEPTAVGFWSWADAATLVDRWAQVLEKDQIRVLVINERDRLLLPATFEQLLALPSGLLSGRTPLKSNRSFTLAEAELLRQAIALTKDQLTWEEFWLFFRAGYTARIVDERRPPTDEPRAVLPVWAAQQAGVEAAHIADRLVASGVQLIGDLDDLMRVPPGGEQEAVDQVPVELAAEALAGVVLAGRGRLRLDQQRLAEMSAELSDGPGEAPLAPRTVDDLTGRELAAALAARVRRRLTRPSSASANADRNST